MKKFDFLFAVFGTCLSPSLDLRIIKGSHCFWLTCSLLPSFHFLQVLAAPFSDTHSPKNMIRGKCIFFIHLVHTRLSIFPGNFGAIN